MTIYGLIKDGSSIGWGSESPFGVVVSGTRYVLVKRTSDNVIGWYDSFPHAVGYFLAKDDSTGQVGWKDPNSVAWVA